MSPRRRKRRAAAPPEPPAMLSNPEPQAAGPPPPPPPAASPVLFLGVDGSPMRFFLCPGPTKVELLPLITACGGLLCKAQEPGAVLLVEPADVGCLTDTMAHRYVSVQYVRDCVEKNEQLELEDYRLKGNTRLTRNSSAKSGATGRSHYTAEEDTAIVDYVATRTNALKGNVLWREMERKHVTGHSWQSMKYHYMNKLRGRATPGPGEGRRRTGEPKTAERQEPTSAIDSSPEHARAFSSEDLTSSDLAQPDHQQADNPPDVEGPDKPGSEVEEEEDNEAASKAPPQHTSSPAKSLKEETTPKPLTAPVVSSSSSSTTRSPRPALRRRLLADVPPPVDTLSKKRATAASPCISPMASPLAGLPWSHPSPPPSPSPSPPPAQPETESNHSPGGGADPAVLVRAETSRKEKRKLGILETATKEFMDDSESDYEEAREDVPEPPKETATAPLMAMSDLAMDTGAAPKPHLFLLNSNFEQAEGSVPVDCEDVAVPAVPRPISTEEEGEAAAVSLTQMQMTEDMQRVTALIKHANQDLVSVTKALWKTSGDFSAALALLKDPVGGSAAGPFWGRCDDELLLTCEPEALRQLQERYGEQGVARRLMFLNVRR